MKKSIHPKLTLWKIESSPYNRFSFKQPSQITYAGDIYQAAKYFLKYFFPYSNYEPVFMDSFEFTCTEQSARFYISPVKEQEKEILLKYKVLLNAEECSI
jgi:hypothetical protein